MKPPPNPQHTLHKALIWALIAIACAQISALATTITNITR